MQNDYPMPKAAFVYIHVLVCVKMFEKYFIPAKKKKKKVVSNSTAGYVFFRSDDVIMYIQNDVIAFCKQIPTNECSLN